MGILLTSILVIVVAVLVIFIAGVITQHVVYTPAFRGADGKVIPGSIAEFRRVKLGGVSQAILIRGKSIDNPVLLYLHCGPGISEMGVSRNMNAALEEYYTVVHWDQRGAGKSYSILLDPQKVTVEHFVQDVHELTQYLKKRLGKEKIVLMGHSWGAGLGAVVAVRFPHDYTAYLGMAQVVKPLDSDQIGYAFAYEQAKKTGNEKAVKELEKVDGYWLLRDAGYLPKMMVNKKWVGYFGGQMYGKKDFSFVFKNMMCHEFTLFDWPALFLGASFSGKAIWKAMFTTDLMQQASEFQMPFFLLMGRHDYNTGPSSTENYFNAVKAPMKKLFWFEKSAHFPNFEERELYHKVMIESVLPIVRTVR
ncbi:MAG: alpha/beta hydrolase [Chitinivibrionales bacterium]|nr:alpha/beta hydrolase [Chitinivibrionales bacterium]